MLNRPRTAEKGFSLVELSIVLVILGLLVGGILAGQSLIRAAELRSITTEQGRFVTAMSAFRDKYFAMPGDFARASEFGWGSYNGDSDGLIDATTSITSATNPGTINEVSAIWIHLSSAGLVEGSYTIFASTSTPVLATNIPRSKLNGAGWAASNLGSVLPTSATHFPANYGNAFLIGAVNSTNTNEPSGVMKAEEAWNIDTKMDDGRADNGSVFSIETHSAAVATGGTSCTTPVASTGATAVTTVTYDLDSTSSTACALIFKTGY